MDEPQIDRRVLNLQTHQIAIKFYVWLNPAEEKPLLLQFRANLGGGGLIDENINKDGLGARLLSEHVVGGENLLTTFGARPDDGDHPYPVGFIESG